MAQIIYRSKYFFCHLPRRSKLVLPILASQLYVECWKFCFCLHGTLLVTGFWNGKLSQSYCPQTSTQFCKMKFIDATICGTFWGSPLTSRLIQLVNVSCEPLCMLILWFHNASYSNWNLPCKLLLFYEDVGLFSEVKICFKNILFYSHRSRKPVNFPMLMVNLNKILWGNCTFIFW